jgi:hypothetical protein
MKCLSCGMQFGDELVRCPRCGFPVIGLVDDSEESREQVLKMAADYRKKHWAGAKIYLEVYTNLITNGEVKVEEKSYILLGETKEMSEGEIRWYPEKFARLKGYCELNVAVENGDAERRVIKLTVPNPKINDFWQVGLKKQADDACCIVVGNENKYAEASFKCN